MRHAPLFTSLFTSLAAVLLTACSGADDRPAPSADLGQLTAPPAPSATPSDDSPPTDTTSATGKVCEPRTKRECQLTYRLADGTTLDCGISVQWCRADGSAWLPCGRTGHGAHGEDTPPY